ncbi:uncharacterized protein METZ01_LOCUS441436, partial [marine metagenome]
MAKIAPGLMTIGIAPIQFGKRSEGLKAGRQFAIAGRASKSLGVHLPDAFGRRRLFLYDPPSPDATLPIQKAVIHQGQGLAGDVGDIPFAHGGEGRREIEGQHEGRDEVAPERGIDGSSTGAVQRTALRGPAATNDKFGQVNRDRLASYRSVQPARNGERRVANRFRFEPP